MIDNIDLKTLKIIHVLCQAGSVSKTAEIMDVTPGAISYMLNKARKATGRALFFRTRQGMEPDALAKELSERYLSVRQDLSVSDQQSAINNRPIIISSYSLAELLLSIAVLNHDKTHPEIIFNRQSHNDNERLIKLRNREVDLDIGTRLPSDKAITQLSFFAGNAGVLISKDHPRISNTVSIQDWQENRHAIWLRGMHFINNDFDKTKRFHELSSVRNIAFIASSSLNLISLYALSDLLVLVPSSVGRQLEKIMPVRMLSAPEELDMRYECYIHFHHSMNGNEKLKNIIDLFNITFDLIV